jgi:hypothetical protein
VGGGEHDWNYLLGELDLLNQDQLVGDVVRAAGALLGLWACLRGWAYAAEIERQRDAGDRGGGP